jgi:hypothetical protein
MSKGIGRPLAIPQLFDQRSVHGLLPATLASGALPKARGAGYLWRRRGSP